MSMEQRIIDKYIKEHTQTIDINGNTMLIVCSMRIENINNGISMAYPLKFYSKQMAVDDFFNNKMQNFYKKD